VISLAQVWEEIERVIPRKELTAALEQLGELVPDDDGDEDAEWRTELIKRYGSVTGFLGLLAQIQLGAVLEQLHRGLRRREIYAVGADGWGDPRARLLDGEQWENAQPKVLKALDLPSDPDLQLRALSITLDDAYRQVAGELSRNAGVVEKGRLRLERLGPAPDPPELEIVRGEIARMMPRVDFPEVLLEIFARSGAGGLLHAHLRRDHPDGRARGLPVRGARSGGVQPRAGAGRAPGRAGAHAWAAATHRCRLSASGDDQRRQRPADRHPERDPDRPSLGRWVCRLRRRAAVRRSRQVAVGSTQPPVLRSSPRRDLAERRQRPGDGDRRARRPRHRARLAVHPRRDPEPRPRS
jgi:hypothetical protein